MVPRTGAAIPRVANSDPIGATDEPGSRSRLRVADFSSQDAQICRIFLSQGEKFFC